MIESSSHRSRLIVIAAALLGSALYVPSASAEVTTAGKAAAAPPLQLPFPCDQKWRLDTWAHAPALDMVKEPNQSGTSGATLVAAAAGTVNQSFYHSNAGNVIQINHGGGYFTTYLHLASRSVGTGARVSGGTVIGKVGKTGPTANNHPHLHFELGYDSNRNGSASWGTAGSERVRPTFNGAGYGSANNKTWRNVVSRNCGGTPAPPPPPPAGGGSKYWVDIHSAAPGHSSPGGSRTGTLNKGRQYVYCRTMGPKVQVGGDYNHWWLKTDLDSGSSWKNQWVSAYYLKRWGNDQAKDNDGRDLPNC